MSPDRHARTMLPIPDRPVGQSADDVRREGPGDGVPTRSSLCCRREGSPNVLVILLDDVGFGASSTFGGPCATLTAQRLADGGLLYNRFHTTALCAPTRQALLTGRNHHSVGMGSVAQTATSAPGNSSLRPNTKAPLALTLKLNGYSTAQLGNLHEVPVWQSSPMGPLTPGPPPVEVSRRSRVHRRRDPVGPGALRGNHPGRAAGDARGGVPPDRGPRRPRDQLGSAQGAHARQAVLRLLRPGATHAPHHVPSEWIEKYAGRFDDGWDAQRQRTFARQKELGVIPADAELTQRHAEIPAWDEMPDQLKPVLARQMEVYAGFLEHTDHHVGRLIDAVEDLGVLDDTVVYYIVGDNGASAEGTLNGAFNEMANFNGMAALETPEFMVSVMDDFGSPRSYNHYSVGWAWAMATPFQWTKQVASHWGGTRNGTIVHWPSRITERGGHRSQFTHVIDVTPTILEAAGLPEPTMVNGVQQSPMEGASMLYSFNDADAEERHDLQYFEMFANRGIYHRGWSAVTKHRTPWVMVGGALPAFDDDVWELYDGSTDYSQAHDVAADHPELLAKLQRLWLIEATKYNVLPMDDRTSERLEPAMAGRPTLIRGTSQTFYPHRAPLGELRRQHQEHVVQRDRGCRRAGVGGG